MERPYLPLYTRDWLDDIALRSCSAASRAILADLMCLAHEGTPYGYLAVKGVSITERFIGGRCNVPAKLLRNAITELLQHGRLHQDETGLISIPRMVKDEALRLKRGSGGKLGGNPALKVNQNGDGKVNLPDNQDGEGKDNPPSRERTRTRSDTDIASAVVGSSGEGVQGKGAMAVASGVGWETYIGIFLAAGKKLNQSDLTKGLRQWLSLETAEQLAAVRDIEATARTREAEFIQFPVNHLKDRPWTRVGPERILPEPSRSAAAQDEAERLFLLRKERDGRV